MFGSSVKHEVESNPVTSKTLPQSFAVRTGGGSPLVSVFFTVAVISNPDKDNLREKGLVLAYRSQGLQSIMAGKAWQQAGKCMVAGAAGTCSHCILTQVVELMTGEWDYKYLKS